MKLADYSQQVTVDQLDAALRAGGFEGVFHYLHGTPGYVLRVEDPAVVTGIRARGWPQAGIDVPFNPGDADGAALVAVARSYGFPPGSRMYLDIEPDRFAVASSSWPGAANGWCDAARGGGFLPGVYGTDATVATCADHADTIWRAVPGECDPAGPGLAAAFFAGRRAIQCSNGTWGGVNFDVNYSQFTLGGSMSVDLTDLTNRVGSLQSYITTPDGITGQGEITVRLRDLSNAVTALRTDVAAIKAQLAALPVGGGLTANQAKQLGDLAAAVARIEAALKAA